MSRLEPTRIRTVYEGRILTVRVESITLPDGTPFDAEIVRHPGSVVIVPVTGAGEIVLVRQYRHAVGREVWEVPAGSLKPGEDLEEAAARECHEEIGLLPGRLERLGSFVATPGYCDEEMHIYRAIGLREPGAADAAAHPDEDEQIETRAFAAGQLRAMVASGELCDMKTVVALGLLGLLGPAAGESGT